MYAVQLQLKVNNVFRSISRIQVVDNNHQEELNSVLTQSVQLMCAHYADMDVTFHFACKMKSWLCLSIVRLRDWIP